MVRDSSPFEINSNTPLGGGDIRALTVREPDHPQIS